MSKKFCGLFSIVLMLSLVSFAAAAGSDSKSDANDPHLMGWWKFDESSGETFADSSGKKRNGVPKGGLSIEKSSTAGRIGKAIKISKGSDEYVEIKGYKGVGGTKARTVMAWIKTKSAKGEILSWGTDDGGMMFTYCFVRKGVGVIPSAGYYYGKSKPADDTWHHVVAVVRDAKLPNLHDDVTLYMDGELEEIDDIGLLDLWPIETGDELDVRIGKGFDGLIDEVRIYDRPLSKEEVKAIFESAKD